MSKAKRIIESLQAMYGGPDLGSVAYMVKFAQELLDAGWLPKEVQAYLAATEEVSPELSESVAMDIMRDIRNNVEARLKNAS